MEPVIFEGEIMNNAGFIYDGDMLIPSEFFEWLKENKSRLQNESCTLILSFDEHNILGFEDIR